MQLSIAFVLSSLVLLAAASPVERPVKTIRIPLNKRGGLTATDGTLGPEALRAHVNHRLAAYQQSFSAYEQNTGAPHPLASKPLEHLSKRWPGFLPLTSVGNSMWRGEITVGNPPQSFTVDLDTGSSDLFLPSVACVDSNCDGHNKYNPVTSRSAHDLHKPFFISYGDGSAATGEQFSDLVSLADYEANDVVVGASVAYSGGLSKSQFDADGVMGMAFKEVSKFGTDSIIESILSDEDAEDQVFAFRLDRDHPELAVGRLNTTLFTGDIAYTPLTHQGFWQISMDAVSVNGTAVVQNVPAIIDTGTTAVLGHTTDVAAFYAAIPGAQNATAELGAGYYTIPCADPPASTFTFGGRAFTMPGASLRGAPLGSDASRCAGNVVGSDSHDFWIVGDRFLSNVYTVFDLGAKRVGFAALSDMSQKPGPKYRGDDNRYDDSDK